MAQASTAYRIRDAVRRQLRDTVLDEARRLTIELGWARVRMGRLAENVGISRQTLYTEFDSKDHLGQEVVSREADHVLQGVAEQFERHPDDLGSAIAAMVTHVLREAETNSLIRAVLDSARGGENSLLPLLTTRSDAIMSAAAGVVGRFVEAHHPELEQRELAVTVDAIVRMTVSHMLFPVEPAEETGARVAELAIRNVHGALSRAGADAGGPAAR
ncbi:TetR/AcrR family transcriptional regulator [Haloechinothrix sp. YIM 98757]|uniref:TetR/AcrR family transcriptional regulator n=1 Tax=Haloechinothrix aidingensis TaxID=2752311 RepID=A0A838ABB3_9PSEU|nr:TetR family transcriptional regulator [Haloechinothrix aidingensis]MBA0126529.1 TetR/AcrR family transcriptional regulator [Haloechinothrix aidingensis]